MAFRLNEDQPARQENTKEDKLFEKRGQLICQVPLAADKSGFFSQCCGAHNFVITPSGIDQTLHYQNGARDVEAVIVFNERSAPSVRVPG